MKTTTFFFLLFLCCSFGVAGAQDSLSFRFIVPDSALYVEPVLSVGPPDSVGRQEVQFSVRSLGGGYGREDPSYDCELIRTEGPWVCVAEGGGECRTAFERFHQWVDAEYGDVNPAAGPTVTLAYYHPCGSPWQTVFARICEKCGREERRVSYYTFEQVPKPVSRYRELKNIFNGGNN